MEFAWEARSSAEVQEIGQRRNGQENRPSGVLPSNGEDEEDEEQEEEEEEEEERDVVGRMGEEEGRVVQPLARCVDAVGDEGSGTQW